MQKITTHLWFDKEAKQAAEFYTSTFQDSARGPTTIKNITVINDTPSGSAHIVNIDLYGQEFTLISAGPLFKINPSISFLVACNSKAEVDSLWEKLLPGSKVLMELNSYPFSERYGWIEDKFGVSWQIMYMGDMEIKQKITPTLMFTGIQCGRAEEAINFYLQLFNGSYAQSESRVNHIMRYTKEQKTDKEGTISHASFTLEGQAFAAMDSAGDHKFNFNEAISLMVHCETQEEIDYYWEALSAVPSSEQCGWLKDKFGISWQIVPTMMEEIFQQKDPQKTARVTQAFLKMKKFDIAQLKKAAEGN